MLPDISIVSWKARHPHKGDHRRLRLDDDDGDAVGIEVQRLRLSRYADELEALGKAVMAAKARKALAELPLRAPVRAPGTWRRVTHSGGGRFNVIEEYGDGRPYRRLNTVPLSKPEALVLLASP